MKPGSSLRSRILAVILLAASHPGLADASDFRELYREGKFGEALTALEASPEAQAKDYVYYFNRGVIHHALNQDPLAVAYLEKAKRLDPASREIEAPLVASTANLAKWLGVARLDATSFFFESLGDLLPLDAAFLALGILSLLSWFGFFLVARFRSGCARLGFVALVLAFAFGGWSAWMDRHPLLILTESRLVKSGPGETFLDRGSVEPGMKVRIVGRMREERPEGGTNWLKIRFNERHELGFVPERSGLLLADGSNTPEP